MEKDYPYMNARIAARRKKLLDEGDYDKMLKMEVNEIARVMEEGDYKSEINDLGADFSGASLIERALNLNMANTFAKLKEISSQEAEPLIQAYLERYDIRNAVRVLRWKRSGQNLSLKHIIYPIGTFDMSYEELAEASENEILESLNLDLKSDILTETRSGSLKEVEQKLFESYYSRLIDIAKDSGSKEFEKLVAREYRDHRLEKVLRIIKNGEEIEGRVEDSKDLKEIKDASNFEEAMESAIELTGVGADTLEEFEHGLKTRRLEEALKTMHKEPLGLSPVIGYLVAKETEVENLRMISRSKERDRPVLEKEDLVIA